MDLRIAICIFILGDLLWLRWANRRLRAVRWGGVARAALAVFIAAQIVYLPLYTFGAVWARSQRNFLPTPLHVSVFLWHALVLPATGLVIAALAIVKWLRLRLTSAVGGASDNPQPAAATPSRRQLLAAGAALVPPIAAFGLTACADRQLRGFRIRRLDVPIANLPRDLDGLTIAQVTDLHLGKFTGPRLVRAAADAINAMAADLVVFSGDLIDFSHLDMLAGIEFLGRLRSRHGSECVAIVEGNHDLLDPRADFENTLRAAALPLLVDEQRTLQIPGRRTPVQLLGLCWGQPASVPGRLYIDDDTIALSLKKVMALRDASTFPLLLTHHPHAFDPAAAAGLPLTLAGHTHGGQIMLTDHIGAGPLRFRYWSGLYRKGASQLFVGNGVCSWFPLRVNAPAEVAKLTLRRA